MKITVLLLAGMLACVPAFADDTQPSPSASNSASQTDQSATAYTPSIYPTKLEAAINQDGGMTKTTNSFKSIGGKQFSSVGIGNWMNKYVTLFPSALSIKPSGPAGSSGSGMDINITVSIVGSDGSSLDGTDAYIDEDELPKVKGFVQTMIAAYDKSNRTDGDNSETSFSTKGGCKIGFIRNGKKDPDCYILNNNSTPMRFEFKNVKDVQRFSDILDSAAAWCTAHQ